MASQRRQKCLYLHLSPSGHAPLENLRQTDELFELDDEEADERGLLGLLGTLLSRFCLRGAEGDLSLLRDEDELLDEEEEEFLLLLDGASALREALCKADCIIARRRGLSGTAGSRRSLRQALRWSSR